MNIGKRRRAMRRWRWFLRANTVVGVAVAAWVLVLWVGGHRPAWLAVWTVTAAVFVVLMYRVTMRLQAVEERHHADIIGIRRELAESAPILRAAGALHEDDADRDVNGRAWWEPGYIGPQE